MPDETEEKIPSDTTSGVIPYKALAADISLSWSFLAKVLRDTDKAKVFGCKEDIDTLLVFAGLFSAVMTAFIIETYKMLLPDPNLTLTGIVSTISLQMASYVVNGRFANSTHSVDSTTPATGFKPSPAAVRINSLWFASLVCSLSAASLGMLIKQWLREYLDGQFISPQAGARVRHFRYQGLTRWKVFEVAAILPLLLQVALGLFFLGLCFFTHLLNETLSLANISLIIAWATLFIFAILAPALSARCPYKTTLLQPLLRTIRRLLWRSINHFCLFFGLSSNPDRSVKLREENEIVLKQDMDIEILLEVDTILSDDELLSTVIRRTLEHIHCNGNAVLQFVSGVAQRRSQLPTWKIGEDSDAGYSNRLTSRCRSALVDIISDAVHSEMKLLLPRNGVHSIADSWVREGLIMICSLSFAAIQDTEALALATILACDEVGFEDIIKNHRRQLLGAPEILTLLQAAQGHLQGERVLRFVQGMLRWFGGWQKPAESTLDVILASIHTQLDFECFSMLSRTFVLALRAQSSPDDDANTRSYPERWVTVTMNYLVNAYDSSNVHHSISCLDDITEFLVEKLMQSESWTSTVLTSLSRRPYFDWHSRYWIFGVLFKQKLHVKNGIIDVLKNMQAALQRDHFDRRFERPDALGLCLVICNLASYFFSPDDIQTYRSNWQDVFVALSELVSNSGSNQPDRAAAAHCLERIDSFDRQDNTGIRMKNTRKFIVPHKLVYELAKMSQNARQGHRTNNLRRVEESGFTLRNGDEDIQINTINDNTSSSPGTDLQLGSSTLHPTEPQSNNVVPDDVLEPDQPTQDGGNLSPAGSIHTIVERSAVGPTSVENSQPISQAPITSTELSPAIPGSKHATDKSLVQGTQNLSTSVTSQPMSDSRRDQHERRIFNKNINGDASDPPLRLDLRYEDAGEILIAGGGPIAYLSLDEFATYPPRSEMTITCSEYPELRWSILLTPNSDETTSTSSDAVERFSVNSSITIKDVLGAVRQLLRQQLSQNEWSYLATLEARSKSIQTAFKERCLTSPSGHAIEASYGMRRIDVLEGKFMFGGLLAAGSDDLGHVTLRLEYSSRRPIIANTDSSEHPDIRHFDTTKSQHKPTAQQHLGFSASLARTVTSSNPLVSQAPRMHGYYRMPIQQWSYAFDIALWLSALDANPNRSIGAHTSYAQYADRLLSHGIKCLGNIIALGYDGLTLLQRYCGPNADPAVAERLFRYAWEDTHGIDVRSNPVPAHSSFAPMPFALLQSPTRRFRTLNLESDGGGPYSTVTPTTARDDRTEWFTASEGSLNDSVHPTRPRSAHQVGAGGRVRFAGYGSDNSTSLSEMSLLITRRPMESAARAAEADHSNIHPEVARHGDTRGGGAPVRSTESRSGVEYNNITPEGISTRHANGVMSSARSGLSWHLMGN